MSRLLGAADVRRIATELDIRPTKKWGQNFVIDPNTVERIVRHIKRADPRYDTPLHVSPDATLRDVAGLIRKRAHSMVVVVDAERVAALGAHVVVPTVEVEPHVAAWRERERNTKQARR